MKVIGLAGRAGSGKSAVARWLAQRSGIEWVDLDRLAWETYAPGTATYERLIEAFGDDIVAPSGQIDRAQLSQRAFADDASLETLNRIVHPRSLGGGEGGRATASSARDGASVARRRADCQLSPRRSVDLRCGRMARGSQRCARRSVALEWATGSCAAWRGRIASAAGANRLRRGDDRTGWRALTGGRIRKRRLGCAIDRAP